MDNGWMDERMDGGLDGQMDAGKMCDGLMDDQWER